MKVTPTSTTNAEIQSCLDYLKVNHPNGGLVVLEPNRVYSGPFAPKIWEGITVDCQGSKIESHLGPTSPGAGIQIAHNAEIRNGFAETIDEGVNGYQFFYGAAISLGAPNTAPDNLVGSRNYFDRGKPRVRNMKLHTTRPRAPVIQATGDVEVDIDGIEIPDSSTCSGVYLDWGDVGGALISPWSGDLDRCNKWRAAFNSNNMFTVHPRGRIRNIKAGKLTVPRSGDEGSRLVRLSGCHDVLVERASAASLTSEAFCHVGGDLGFEFAPTSVFRKAYRNIFAHNISVDKCSDHAVFIDTNADNVRNAVAAGYATRAGDPIVDGNIVVDGLTLMGTFNGGDTNDGIRISQAIGVTVRNIKVTGFYYGVNVEDNTRNVLVEGGTVWRNRAIAGCAIRDAANIDNVRFKDLWVHGNGLGVTGATAFSMAGRECKVMNCVVGPPGGDDAQVYGVYIQPGGLYVAVLDTSIRSLKAGGQPLKLSGGNDPQAVGTVRDVRYGSTLPTFS